MSTLPAGYRVVEVPENRRDEFLELDRAAFAQGSTPEFDATIPIFLPWDRTVGVQAPDGTLAAVHASYQLVLPVPGGRVPCSGLTWVGARPDQRRRGLLRAMIDAHFARSLARDEPVSALFAAEAAIYGRFGYGSACDDARVKLSRGAALRDVPGSADLTVRFTPFDAVQHDRLLDDLHRATGSDRPGWITRDDADLRRNRLFDPYQWRHGAEALQLVTVHAADGAPRGYALMSRTPAWTDGSARYTAKVREAGALDAAATHRLWTFLLDLDLTVSVEGPMLAVDDPLLHLLVDQRATVPRLCDNVWVRLLDVPTALAARSYAAPVDVVLDVSDDLLPANSGRWRLTTGDGDDGAYPARVTRTEDPTDVALDVRELGALYLGGRSLVALVRAGLATEVRPGAAAAAATAFGWPVAPVCSWVF